MKNKFRIGFFSLSSCEGCMLSILEDGKKFMQLSDAAEIADFRLLKKGGSKGSLHISIVEGCIVSVKEKNLLKQIRGRSRYIISLGACAGSGCVQAMRNRLPEVQQKKLLKSLSYSAENKVMKIDEIVKVDYYMRGCPINADEFYSVINVLLHNSIPRQHSAPVCFECKERHVLCKYYTEGGYCLGPVTVGGCNAVCTAGGDICWGCRGLAKDANIPQMKILLESRGLGKKEIESLFQIYNSGSWD